MLLFNSVKVRQRSFCQCRGFCDCFPFASVYSAHQNIETSFDLEILTKDRVNYEFWKKYLIAVSRNVKGNKTWTFIYCKWEVGGEKRSVSYNILPGSLVIVTVEV